MLRTPPLSPDSVCACYSPGECDPDWVISTSSCRQLSTQVYPHEFITFPEELSQCPQVENWQRPRRAWQSLPWLASIVFLNPQIWNKACYRLRPGSVIQSGPAGKPWASIRRLSQWPGPEQGSMASPSPAGQKSPSNASLLSAADMTTNMSKCHAVTTGEMQKITLMLESISWEPGLNWTVIESNH